jgi:hypothetical protein
MAKPEVYGDFEKLQQTQLRFRETEKMLKETNDKWEQIATAIDALNNS